MEVIYKNAGFSFLYSCDCDFEAIVDWDSIRFETTFGGIIPHKS